MIFASILERYESYRKNFAMSESSSKPSRIGPKTLAFGLDGVRVAGWIGFLMFNGVTLNANNLGDHRVK